ncbi:hypothetical protein Dda_4713 [Drechslerella dactyloides]|uniref:Zn(2)-C6 fungal-type domain-containing protein n=1 Tax=Drechslerella dactyloides TaxID=74499 RepID=A0AAD6J1T6_DREDA|nr:hypothetical protein Dda_4713 [Drechslerella dactyloides]
MHRIPPIASPSDSSSSGIMNLQDILTESAPNQQQQQQPQPQPHSPTGVVPTPQQSPQAPKHVAFALLTDPEQTDFQGANLPNVKFYINAHDTTESIASTVKSFFGLFSDDPATSACYRVSFEDNKGTRMILSYDNIADQQTIYVRAIAEPILSLRGTSPGKGCRIGGAAMSRSRSNKRHASSTPTPDADSRKLVEPVASADISVENILEGSRRKRPKFESSELPLFPEMTNRFGPPSSSSASPSRPTPQLTPYSQPGHHSAYPHPQSAYLYSLATEPTPPPSATTTGRVGLPTPAPTIASCISDEDAAIQLMRLGEKPTNNGNSLPNHIRHQYSPDLDYNGQPTNGALLPSPVSHGYSQQTSPVRTGYVRVREYDEVEDDRDANYMASDDYPEEDEDVPLFTKRSHFAPSRQAPPPPVGKKKSPTKLKKSKKLANGLIPAPQLNAFPGYPADTSFNGLEAATSLANLANPDVTYMQPGIMMPPEPQENQKPRCQRCRKSKKGCDRQRPCQRCKDAGIPADQCISEDEAGTRRGRMNAAKAAAANGIVKPKVPKIKKRKIIEEI